MRQTIKALIITIVFQIATANVSWAIVMDIEGNDTSGVNDTVADAQDLGTVSNGHPLTASGWIDVNNQNDVDFYQFSVSDTSLGLYFDIDYADDVAQTDKDLGLDSALWVFNAAGELIAWSDWSDFFINGSGNQGTDPGSDPFGDGDAFIGELMLSSGTYFAAVSYVNNEATALWQGATFQLFPSGYAISGTTPDTSFLTADCIDPATGLVGDPAIPANRCTGQYQLQIRTNFDDIPEPASFALLSMGLLGVVVHRRLLQGDRSPALLTGG